MVQFFEPNTGRSDAYRLNDVKFEVFPEHFVGKLKDPQLVAVGRSRVNMHFRYLWDPAYITFIFSWAVLIIKIFHQTIIFFNEVLFTSYCCVRYFHKRKKLYFIYSLDFSFVIFPCKRCLLGQTKRRGTLLTILRSSPRIFHFLDSN